jgi:hypothetical protein
MGDIRGQPGPFLPHAVGGSMTRWFDGFEFGICLGFGISNFLNANPICLIPWPCRPSLSGIRVRCGLKSALLAMSARHFYPGPACCVWLAPDFRAVYNQAYCCSQTASTAYVANMPHPRGLPNGHSLPRPRAINRAHHFLQLLLHQRCVRDEPLHGAVGPAGQ